MTSLASTYPFGSLLHARTLRHARCYAPEAVVLALRAVLAEPAVAVAIDVDCLERSARAKLDRVMLLALDALARAGVQIVLVALHDRERAALARRMIVQSRCVHDAADLHAVIGDVPRIVISDDPDVLSALRDSDRGIVLGRPELVGGTVVAADDTAVRATLWWMFAERTRAAVA
jgi:hypothetical protein